MNTNTAPLGWFGIVRLGLVQTALGSIVVLTTSTLNRVMVVELALPAILPGTLIAVHYAMQVLRPCLGHSSDLGGRRTPWIVGGMAVLAIGGSLAAVATALMGTYLIPGLALAVVAFILIGIGVGATGTTLLVLLAARADPSRQAAAATVVWVMMLGGFVITATTAGHLLDPFSPTRLVVISSANSVAALLLTLLAVRGLEGTVPPSSLSRGSTAISFVAALSEVWAEPKARRFAIFVFVSMLAYSAQDLIVEPFAGTVFGFTPGETTKLAGTQHAGVLIGMLTAGALGGARLGSMHAWTIGGCVGSAAALVGLATAAIAAPSWPLRVTVLAIGFANGIYAVATIGSMMALVGAGRESRHGVRMGLWGAAQAIAFGLGGFAGTLASDIARYILRQPSTAYATVFVGEAILFIVSAVMAALIHRADSRPTETGPGPTFQIAA